jgi:hypothetical protein
MGEHGGGVLDLVEIPGKLKIEPELCLHSEEPLETKCRIRCNPTLSMNELIYARIRDTHLLSQFHLRQAHGLQKLL